MMKSFEKSDLKLFLNNKKDFDVKCLEDLFLICCVAQHEKSQLVIWVDTDVDANPISIDLYDDEFGILDVAKFKSEFLDLFATESDFINPNYTNGTKMKNVGRTKSVSLRRI